MHQKDRWPFTESDPFNLPGCRLKLINFNGQTLTDQHSPCMVVYNANVAVNPFGNRGDGLVWSI